MNSLNLGKSERARALEKVASYENYGSFMAASIAKSSSSRQSTRLQSLQLLARPIGTFIYTFEQLIAPEQVDMTLIWGLIYSNVNVSYTSSSRDPIVVLIQDAACSGRRRKATPHNPMAGRFEARH